MPEATLLRKTKEIIEKHGLIKRNFYDPKELEYDSSIEEVKQYCGPCCITGAICLASGKYETFVKEDYERFKEDFSQNKEVLTLKGVFLDYLLSAFSDKDNFGYYKDKITNDIAYLFKFNDLPGMDKEIMTRLLSISIDRYEK